MKHRLFWLLTFLLVPTQAFAADSGIKNAIDKLRSASEQGGLGSPSDQGTEITNLISNLINLTVGVLGVVAVLLMIYAGGLWLTAAGNDDKVGQAKQIMKTTLVGIIIVGLAYAITTFILQLVVGDSAL